MSGWQNIKIFYLIDHIKANVLSVLRHKNQVILARGLINFLQIHCILLTWIWQMKKPFYFWASKIVDINYLGMCGNYSNLLFENVWIKNSTN